MNEDNIVKIIVTVITLFGTIVGILAGYIARARHESVLDAKREQEHQDHFEKIFDEMNEIKKRLDTHNRYAEKFGDIEKSIIAIKKDIEYIRKER